MRRRVVLVAVALLLAAVAGAVFLAVGGGAGSQAGPPPSKPAGKVARLRVVSFNAWGLPFGQAAELEARLARMPKALRALDADVLCLQECWTGQVKDALIEGMAPEYEAAPAFGGGLVLLSRKPLSEAKFTPFPEAPGLSFLERLAGKGVLAATVATEAGPVRVVDVHCTAFDHASRDFQVRHLLDAILPREPDLPTILAGDWNLHPVDAGPDGGEALGPIYEAILAAGFSAARPPVRAEGGGFAMPAPGTFGGWPRPESDEEARLRDFSIDHVFVRGGGGRTVRVADARVEWWNRATALSDHNLLLVDVEVGFP